MPFKTITIDDSSASSSSCDEDIISPTPSNHPFNPRPPNRKSINRKHRRPPIFLTIPSYRTSTVLAHLQIWYAKHASLESDDDVLSIIFPSTLAYIFFIPGDPDEFSSACLALLHQDRKARDVKLICVPMTTDPGALLAELMVRGLIREAATQPGGKTREMLEGCAEMMGVNLGEGMRGQPGVPAWKLEDTIGAPEDRVADKARAKLERLMWRFCERWGRY